MPEAAAPAAAGGPGPAADLRRHEDHHGYGAHRRSGCRHRGDHSGNAGPGVCAGGCGPYPGNGGGGHQDGHGKRGFLRPERYCPRQAGDCP